MNENNNNNSNNGEQKFYTFKRVIITREKKERIAHLIPLIEGGAITKADEVTKNHWKELVKIITEETGSNRQRTWFFVGRVTDKRKDHLKKDNVFGGKTGDPFYVVWTDSGHEIYATSYVVNSPEEFQKVIVLMTGEKYEFECEKWGEGKSYSRYRLRSLRKISE